MINKCSNDRESYDDRKCDNDRESYRVLKKNGPKYRFLALFSCWMVLYGPKRYCMIRAYRCVALDTPLTYILEKNAGTPHGATKLKGLDQTRPFEALGR